MSNHNIAGGSKYVLPLALNHVNKMNWFKALVSLYPYYPSFRNVHDSNLQDKQLVLYLAIPFIIHETNNNIQFLNYY